jgi:hypothetical protein
MTGDTGLWSFVFAIASNDIACQKSTQDWLAASVGGLSGDLESSMGQ